MNPGYFSEAAVKDLLAVKTGEIDFLKQQVAALTRKCDSLVEELEQAKLTVCTCY
jgi:hypothetical protein